VIVGNNSLALAGAKDQAERLGYNTLVLEDSFAGDAREVALAHATLAGEIACGNGPVGPPACIISGGEATVKVRGGGLGGRNQEFALAAAIAIDGNERIVILSGGTDGTDGPTEAAGGIVDGTTIQRARQRALDAHKFLLDNDSYHFLNSVGDLLVTGPTFTNVMDLRVVLVDER
jgi:glycerate 2-kinase